MIEETSGYLTYTAKYSNGKSSLFTFRIKYTEQYDTETKVSTLIFNKMQAKCSSGGWYNWVYWLDGTISVNGEVLFSANSVTGTNRVYIKTFNTYYDVNKTTETTTGGTLKDFIIVKNAHGAESAQVSINLVAWVSGGGGGDGWRVVRDVEIPLVLNAEHSSNPINPNPIYIDIGDTNLVEAQCYIYTGTGDLQGWTYAVPHVYNGSWYSTIRSSTQAAGEI
jgi:hypothetical protein